MIDLDIRAFFDSLDWELLMKAVSVHVKQAWMLLYIQRWLQAPAVGNDGVEQPCQSGTPQGGVVSPVLAKLFLHYAFDAWMKRTYPEVLFERYAANIVMRCASEEQAQRVLEAVRQRLKECRGAPLANAVSLHSDTDDVQPAGMAGADVVQRRTGLGQ